MIVIRGTMALTIAVDGLADGLKQFALCIGVRGMRAEGEGEDGVELAELRDQVLGALPKVLPRLLECLLLAVLQSPDDVKPGEILKLLEIHFERVFDADCRTAEGSSRVGRACGIQV